MKALPTEETIVLAGQKGPAYFLMPVLGDVVLEDRELRRAMAKASLRQTWKSAECAPNAPTDEEIDSEIDQVRFQTYGT